MGGTRSRSLALAALLACLTALALLPSGARAVTVGAPLGLPANQVEGCEQVVLLPLRAVVPLPPSCTFLGADSAGAWTSQTPRGNWRVRTARVRTGPRVGPMAFTMVRALRSQAGSPPAGIICCTSAAESAPFLPAPNSVNEVAVDLPAVNTVELIDGEPVEVVDYLGITLLDLNSAVPFNVAPGSAGVASYIAPAMRLGQQRLIDGSLPATTVLLNGEFEPAAGPPPPAPVAPPAQTAFRFLPGSRALPGGRARLGAVAPGPGLLRALAAGRGAAASARRAKPRPAPLLSPARLRVKRAGRANLTVKLSKAGKKRLHEQGKLRLQVRLIFKPDGGKAVSRQRVVTFEANPPRARGAR